MLINLFSLFNKILELYKIIYQFKLINRILTKSNSIYKYLLKNILKLKLFFLIYKWKKLKI